MRIGFDARIIDHPGIGRYIRNLLRAILGIASGHEFILYGDPGKLREFKGHQIKGYQAPIYSWKEFFYDPFGKDSLDLVHVPHFNTSLLGTTKLVITIHDLIYLKFPESSSFFRSRAVRPLISNAVRKADRIIAVSENTKKDIIENFPGARGKTEVVYEAADPLFRKIDGEERKEGIRQKYNLPRGIILFVGSLKKHKNIERLIDAYLDLKSKGIQHKLVIVGRYMPREKEILKKTESAGALYLGEIPSEDLLIIYNLAALLVIPSLYEGFGLPVLEAMACGLPVAASNASSLPEVVGDGGLLFDPRDTSHISEVIYRVLTDKRLKSDLTEKGLKRARSFSWEETARQTLKIYRETG